MASKSRRHGQKTIWKILRYTLWILPALIGFGVQRIFSGYPALVENLLSRGLFRGISAVIAPLVSLIPFSLTELLVIWAVPSAVFLGFLFVRKIRRTERYDRGQVVGRIFHRLLWSLSIAYLMFMVLHGWNYARLPVSETFGLPVAARSAKDLAAASIWLARRATEARDEVSEGANGSILLTAGIRGTLDSASLAYKIAATEYPLLAGPAIRPKGVMLSRFWSYTGISGMYFPFFVEANINTDVTHDSLTDTILHEIAHTRGFAREDEAGFIAFLTGIRHPSADFRYGAYLEAFLSLSGQLYTYDADAWTACWAAVSDGIRRDLAARSAYWKQFEGPVQQVSEQVNNAYLQANLQKDGVYSYGRKADLILAYLFSKDPGESAILGGIPVIRIAMDGHRHVFPVSDILRAFFSPVLDLGDGFLQAGDGPCTASVCSRTCPAGEPGQTFVQTQLSVIEGLGQNGAALERSEIVPEASVKREVKRQLYGILSDWTGCRFPWGSLTGIRPTLVARECLARADGDLRSAAALMADTYGVDPRKAALALETAGREDETAKTVPPESACVYIGIPFCPSRCAYCSFTLPECSVRMDLADAYVDALVFEAQRVFSALRMPVSCVYIGGGTPTSLQAGAFKRMLSGVLGVLPMQPGCEVTVEAGRPDTLDAEKLQAMRDHGVGRICVNPQTLNDGTLRRIGRRHTAQQVGDAVELVRRAGIPILNMDLIAGLPGETPADFMSSLRMVCAWHPENVTIHALSMKRKSLLADQVRREGRTAAGIGQLHLPDPEAAAMMMDAYQALTQQGMRPYYLYRQKDAVGGLENTGYAAPGAECRYNVSMMGDRRSVIGLGSGAMSKRAVGNRVERIPTVREIGKYIDSVGEMAERIIVRFIGTTGGNPS